MKATFNLQPSTFNAQAKRHRRVPALDVGSSMLNVECSRRLGKCPPHSSRGVALIVTLIMLAVITFMATTFLVLSRRERNSVTTNTDQTTARFTADTALERAKGRLLAGILSVTNDQNFDLMVPTNFFNPYGFDPAAVDFRTNVNYNYTKAGATLTLAQQQQNIANLLYDPRPPVYITNTKVTNDFRYYLDLNRNGVFDDTGHIPEIGPDGFPVVNFGVTNYTDVIGDPQWIGVLTYPDRPHSADNPFVSRWTYLVLPAGKTLDVNFLHNQARNVSLGLNDGFFRNEGVGTWEINLAAFLADLSPNIWWTNFVGAPYDYRQVTTFNQGMAFDDARELLSWRYGNAYANLASMSSTFNNSAAFINDNIDEYSDGPPMLGTGLTNETLIANQDSNPGNPWPGSYNPQHFFTPQDFFDGTKSPALAKHLLWAGSSNASPTRYTYYRMLAQLGTDSSPPAEDKININYRNVTNGVVVSGMETNLYAWTPLEFFTNSAARMFEKLNIRDFKGNLVTVTNILIWTTNRDNYYSPAVHRILQLAANIYEATTNSVYPCIYRPLFKALGTPATNIIISGYELVNGSDNLPTDPTFLTPPLDLNDAADVAKVGIVSKPNMFGAPWIIGAKKGFPNLNQIAMESVSQMTRKLLIYRPLTKSDWTGYQGKQMLILGVSNSIAVEVWNSYNTVYPRPLYIQADCKLTVQLTNDAGYTPAPVSYYLGIPFPLGATNLPASALLNTGLQPPLGTAGSKQPRAQSFVVPLQTNLVFLPDSVQLGTTMYAATDSTAQWNLLPWGNLTNTHWGVNLTNSIRCIVTDGGAGGRVVDYVQLSHMDFVRNLSKETLAKANKLDVWTDTLLTSGVYWASAATPFSQGIVKQLQISQGSIPVTDTEWTDNGGLSVGTRAASIANFLNFMTTPTVSSNSIQAPFTPTAKMYQLTKWQANDPLVHYLTEDLTFVGASTNDILIPPNGPAGPPKVTDSMYRLNERFSPWGGNGPKTGWSDMGVDPHMFDTAIKDPQIMVSDNWNFPTNKFPSVGWLGRVHRGTPWQTIYMKAADIVATDLNKWQQWSGSANTFIATNIAPTQDRQLFEVFTTSLGGNASRGQLSINQTNVAAWSAVLSGVIALTNDPVGLLLYPTVISPAGLYGSGTVPELAQIVQGINFTRANNFATNGPVFLNNVFNSLGDILATPQLTDMSPYLTNAANNIQANLQQINAGGITDEVLERIPQQIMSLLTISHTPRFVIYSYGQTLSPANNSVLSSGAFKGMVTNYQVTAETATRAVVRVDGAPTKPHVVVEQYNILPPN